MKDLIKRVLEISKKNHSSHIGSCVSVLPLIEAVYDTKEKDEPFILSSGHAALALYVVLEDRYGLNAEDLFKKHGVHPNRDMKDHIDYSTGSLGHGIGAAVGMALADRDRSVFCITSDGESHEGSWHEALRIAHSLKLTNLQIIVNCNGYTALSAVKSDFIMEQCRAFTNLFITFCSTNFDNIKFLKGVDAHYYVMKETDET